MHKLVLRNDRRNPLRHLQLHALQLLPRLCLGLLSLCHLLLEVCTRVGSLLQIVLPTMPMRPVKAMVVTSIEKLPPPDCSRRRCSL